MSLQAKSSRFFCFASLAALLLVFLSCTINENPTTTENTVQTENGGMSGHLTNGSYIRDIVQHPAFKGFGELLLPLDDNSGYYDTKLSDVRILMPYHGHVVPDDVVATLNHMIDEAGSGKTIFYNFYTEEQMLQDPGKRNTGLFFFRGKSVAPFAVVCPGGGFSYVGSLHSGIPQV